MGRPPSFQSVRVFRFLSAVALLGLLALGSVLAAGVPILFRPIVALAIAGGLAAIAIRRQGLAILLTFGFLAALGLLRRLLIPIAGWPAFDPFLLVGPAMSALLLLRFLVSKRRILAPDLLPGLVLALFLLTLLEALNPLGGGSLVGRLAGLLLLAAPMLWFFVGREVADEQTVSTLLGFVIAWALLAALYGLGQTVVGLPAWDSDWLRVAGYAALLVGTGMRAFGPFASSAEYATYLAIAIVLALAIGLRRHPLALAPIPILAWALFLDSTRMLVILAVIAIVVMAAIRLENGIKAVSAISLGLLTIGATTILFGPWWEALARDSGNALLVHQLAGLLHPLDPARSTLIAHLQQIRDGISFGLQNPLGLGTAATNLAGAKFGGTTMRTEADVSNAFVSLGLLGGLLFLAIVMASFAKAVKLARQRRDAVALSVVGILIVTFDQWLNGGLYAATPFLWFMIGWASRATGQESVHDESLTRRERWRAYRAAIS